MQGGKTPKTLHCVMGVGLPSWLQWGCRGEGHAYSWRGPTLLHAMGHMSVQVVRSHEDHGPACSWCMCVQVMWAPVSFT